MTPTTQFKFGWMWTVTLQAFVAVFFLFICLFFVYTVLLSRCSVFFFFFNSVHMEAIWWHVVSQALNTTREHCPCSDELFVSEAICCLCLLVYLCKFIVILSRFGHSCKSSIIFLQSVAFKQIQLVPVNFPQLILTKEAAFKVKTSLLMFDIFFMCKWSEGHSFTWIYMEQISNSLLWEELLHKND